MSHEPLPLALNVRRILLVEKSNLGLNLEMELAPLAVVPESGDAFQMLNPNGNGEYQEFHVVYRIFREVPDAPEDVALFDVVCVAIRRPVQWQP